MKKNKQNIDLILILCSLTGLVCFSLWPKFHPESILHLEYQKNIDLLLHSGYYFLITIISSYIFQVQLSLKNNLILFCSLILISFLFEIIQIWIPERSFSIFDLKNNIIGISLGIFLSYYYHKIIQAKKFKLKI